MQIRVSVVTGLDKHVRVIRLLNDPFLQTPCDDRICICVTKINSSGNYCSVSRLKFLLQGLLQDLPSKISYEKTEKRSGEEHGIYCSVGF